VHLVRPARTTTIGDDLAVEPGPDADLGSAVGGSRDLGREDFLYSFKTLVFSGRPGSCSDLDHAGVGTDRHLAVSAAGDGG